MSVVSSLYSEQVISEKEGSVLSDIKSGVSKARSVVSVHPENVYYNTESDMINDGFRVEISDGTTVINENQNNIVEEVKETDRVEPDNNGEQTDKIENEIVENGVNETDSGEEETTETDEDEIVELKSECIQVPDIDEAISHEVLEQESIEQKIQIVQETDLVQENETVRENDDKILNDSSAVMEEFEKELNTLIASDSPAQPEENPVSRTENSSSPSDYTVSTSMEVKSVNSESTAWVKTKATEAIKVSKSGGSDVGSAASVATKGGSRLRKSQDFTLTKRIDLKGIYTEPLQKKNGVYMAPLYKRISEEVIENVYVESPFLTVISYNESNGIVECSLDGNSKEEQYNEFYEFMDRADDLMILHSFKESMDWFQRDMSVEELEEFYKRSLYRGKKRQEVYMKIRLPFQQVGEKINPLFVMFEDHREIDFRNTMIYPGQQLKFILHLRGIKMLKYSMNLDISCLQMKYKRPVMPKPVLKDYVFEEDPDDDFDTESILYNPYDGEDEIIRGDDENDPEPY